MMQDIYEKLKLTLILKSKSLKAFIYRLRTKEWMLHANIYQKKVYLTKEHMQMTDKGIKDAPHRMSSGKCRIKQQ